MAQPVTVYPPIFFDPTNGTHAPEDPGVQWYGPFDYGANQHLVGYSEGDFYCRAWKTGDGGATWTQTDAVSIETAQLFCDWKGGSTLNLAIWKTSGWETFTLDLTTGGFSSLTSIGIPTGGADRGEGFLVLSSGKLFFLNYLWETFSSRYVKWSIYNGGWESYGWVDHEHLARFMQSPIEDDNGIVHVVGRFETVSTTPHVYPVRYMQVNPATGVGTTPVTIVIGSGASHYDRKGLSPMVLDWGANTIYLLADSSTGTSLATIYPVTNSSPTISTSLMQTRYKTAALWLAKTSSMLEAILNATDDSGSGVIQLVYQKSANLGSSWQSPVVYHDDVANPVFPGTGGQYIHNMSCTRFSNGEYGIYFALLNYGTGKNGTVGVYMSKRSSRGNKGAYFGKPFGSGGAGYFL